MKTQACPCERLNCKCFPSDLTMLPDATQQSYAHDYSFYLDFFTPRVSYFFLLFAKIVLRF
jgi:hypothetical protein